MQILEFNGKLNNAIRRLRSRVGEGVAAEQAHLRELLQDLDEDDRRWAEAMIDELPTRATPPPRSELYAEALELQDNAMHGAGSDEERITVIADARKRIWEIADRAPDAESADIRALTRMLEHLEEGLRNQPWDNPPIADH